MEYIITALDLDCRALIMRMLNDELESAKNELERLNSYEEIIYNALMSASGVIKSATQTRKSTIMTVIRSKHAEYVNHIRDCIAFVERVDFSDKPPWWPKCPYPESIFTMTHEEYVEAVPDENLRERISGLMARFGWNVASDAIFEAIKNQINGD